MIYIVENVEPTMHLAIQYYNAQNDQDTGQAVYVTQWLRFAIYKTVKAKS